MDGWTRGQGVALSNFSFFIPFSELSLLYLHTFWHTNDAPKAKWGSGSMILWRVYWGLNHQPSNWQPLHFLSHSICTLYSSILWIFLGGWVENPESILGMLCLCENGFWYNFTKHKYLIMMLKHCKRLRCKNFSFQLSTCSAPVNTRREVWLWQESVKQTYDVYFGQYAYNPSIHSPIFYTHFIQFRVMWV